jgi:3-methylfumaryl-CoA hydratase
MDANAICVIEPRTPGHLRAYIGSEMSVEDVVSARVVEQHCATREPHLVPVEDRHAPVAVHWCLSPLP